MAKTLMRHVFSGLLVSLLVGCGSKANASAPTSAAAPPAHHHQTVENALGNNEHFNYFYSPAEFLQLCAQFPSLAVCQEMSSLVEKRKSAYMRFGRSAPEAMELEEEDGSPAMEKRKSAYMRFGKRSPVEEEEEKGPNEELEQGVEKRKSAYMRFGKRKSAYMRFGKRSPDPVNEMEKRKSAYMRFGKRSPMDEENMSEMEKRKSAYMRFGKRR